VGVPGARGRLDRGALLLDLPDGLALGRAALALRNADVMVLDEVGPWELHGSGWCAELDALARATCRCCWSCGATGVAAVAERWRLDGAEEFAVARPTRSGWRRRCWRRCGRGRGGRGDAGGDRRGDGPVRAILTALLATVAVAAPAPAQNPHIAAVENGLLPSLRIRGQTRTMRLAERMAFHKVPGVSVAVINDGGIEWARATGCARRAARRPWTPRPSSRRLDQQARRCYGRVAAGAQRHPDPRRRRQHVAPIVESAGQHLHPAAAADASRAS